MLIVVLRLLTRMGRLPLTLALAGGGVSIFVQNPDVVFDCGATLGVGTNNSAELFALGSCLTELRKLTCTHPHVKRILIFSDSKLAINAATGSRRPLTNIPFVLELRKAFAALLSVKLSVALHWVPGHAGIGGNDRVDKIAKTFACSSAAFATNSLAGFASCVSRNPWPYFPIRAAPVHVFALNLPVPVSFRTDLCVLRPLTQRTCPAPAFAAVDNRLSQRTVAVSSHSMSLRRRTEGHRSSGGYFSSGYCQYHVGPEVGLCSLEPVEREAATPGCRPTTVCGPRGSMDTVSDSDFLDHKHDA